MTHDRMHRQDFTLSHEALAVGVKRPTNRRRISAEPVPSGILARRSTPGASELASRPIEQGQRQP
jgi:hypothetical protein